MWPYIGKYVKTLLKMTVEPDLNRSLPALMTPFRFQTIDLGYVVSYIQYNFSVLRLSTTLKSLTIFVNSSVFCFYLGF